MTILEDGQGELTISALMAAPTADELSPRGLPRR
jgi:hypothetical protein